VWIKNHWYIPLIAVLALAAFFSKRSDVAKDLLKTRNKSYKDQIDVLNESHANEIEKRDEIIRVHKEVMDQLDEQLDDDLRENQRKKEKRIKELVEENHDNPEELSRALGDVFGIKYVPRDE
jgi:AraC-like DNA-binding protein